MTNRRLLYLLGELGACDDACRWVESTGLDLGACFDACEHPEWLSWLLDVLVERGYVDTAPLVAACDALLAEVLAGETDALLGAAHAAYLARDPGDGSFDALTERAYTDDADGRRAQALRAAASLLRHVAREDLRAASPGYLLSRVAYNAACVRRDEEWLPDPDEAADFRPRIRAWVLDGLRRFDRDVDSEAP